MVYKLNIMSYIINKDKLSFENGNSIKFNNDIKKIIDFGNIIVILLEREVNSDFINNVYGVNMKKNEIEWQIDNLVNAKYENVVYNGINSPYVDIYKTADDEVKLINWDGTKIHLDVNSGTIISNIIESRKGRRTW